MNSHDENHSRKIRNLIILIVAAVLILFVGIWAISSAIKSGNKANEVAKTETSKVEQTNKQPGTSTTVSSPANQYEGGTVVTSDPVVVSNQENIPHTGPASVVLSAIMLGVATFLLGVNMNLKKAENRQ